MQAILRDLTDRLETPRLILRCPRPGDGVQVHEAVVETLAALRAWPASLPWAMAEPSVDASEAFCRQGQVDFLARKALPLLVFLKDGDGLVGASGLHHLDWGVPKAEVGYWCRGSLQSRGLTAEATRAVVDWGFESLGMRRVACLSDAANTASRRVAERAGFRLEGIMIHERADPDGSLRDTCLYAVTR